MSETWVKKTTELKNPSEPGLHFRIICMTGPNKGAVFYFSGKRLILGRGDGVDIQILDSKMSREHAELSFLAGEYIITDFNTQNGIIVADQKVKQKKLDDNDKIVIGSTVLKYNKIVVDEVLLPVNLPGDESGAKISRKLTSKISNKNEIQSNELEDEVLDKAPKKKSNVLIIIVILLGAFYVLFEDEAPKKNQARKSGNRESEFNSESEMESNRQKMLNEDPEVKRKFDMLIHSGRREYGEGNYFRAMEEFRRADLLIPGSGMASFLMSRAKQRLDEDVRKNFDKGNKDLESKKFLSATASFCGIIQLLQKHPEDQRYIDASEKISAIEKETGLNKGDIKCLEAKPAEPNN